MSLPRKLDVSQRIARYQRLIAKCEFRIAGQKAKIKKAQDHIQILTTEQKALRNIPWTP